MNVNMYLYFFFTLIDILPALGDRAPNWWKNCTMEWRMLQGLWKWKACWLEKEEFCWIQMSELSWCLFSWIMNMSCVFFVHNTCFTSNQPKIHEMIHVKCMEDYLVGIKPHFWGDESMLNCELLGPAAMQCLIFITYIYIYIFFYRFTYS